MMSSLSYKINITLLSASECFAEASKEELRVLLALIERGGCSHSQESLATAARVSRSRCASALALWQESGIITPYEKLDTGALVIDEFEENPLDDSLREEDSVTVAASIRNKDLKELFNICAGLMGRPSLSTHETRQIVSLMDQYGLTYEYISTLCAHLAGKPDYLLTTSKLVLKAKRLVERDITTTEELEIYIKDEAMFWEYRRVLGISGDRTLSDSERKYFSRWSGEYGFGTQIVALAYDITVMVTGGRKLPYMNKLLNGWHEAGCKTVEECRANHETHRVEATAKHTAKKEKAKPKEAKIPKYSNFDADDALMAALERSYNTDASGDDET